jgi:glycine/serine hydroxymethyltransferase
MLIIADLIDRTVLHRDKQSELEKIRQEVEYLAQKFQIYSHL